MNALTPFPAREAGKVETAANDAFAAGTLQDLIAEWSRLHLAMSMPRYNRETERAYHLVEWKLGKAYARVFQIDDPENVQRAADELRTMFNHDPETDGVWDEGALPEPDYFARAQCTKGMGK